MNLNHYIPWVEKYRPSDFKQIVLEKNNKIIFNNILKTKYFPNLLLYGPPGTGKTTTIINLINSFQKDNNQMNKGLMIHLNASDERGIDIIRNQINSFVNSKTLFENGIKFVLLDEVDYMTKNAQFALKYLLQEYRENIRFCLICNYISKIDESLQNEFVKLKFNQLPKDDIINFLNVINLNEKLNLNISNLESIQNIYKSDIRSMINYMQSNQEELFKIKVLTNKNFEELLDIIRKGNFKYFSNEIQKITVIYNIDLKNLVKNLLNYIIRYKKSLVSEEILFVIEHILHNTESNNEYQINYLYYSLSNLKVE